MGKRDLNRLTLTLRDICRDRVVDEKWLLAPTRRVAFQWLDSVARSGQPVLNVRVKTLRHIVLDFASTEMARRGVTLLREVRAGVLVDRLFERLRASGGGYTTGLAPSPGLTKTLTHAIRDLRLAGLKSGSLRAGAFEVTRKGEEIKRLLKEYEKALEAERLVDDADLLRMAAEKLKSDPGVLAKETLLLVPEDVAEDLCLLEKAFLDRIPEKQRINLPVDQPGIPSTAGIFRAVGEVNEVREVLRSCVSQGIPFDEVEILHTDEATYVPLFYEIASGLTDDDSGEGLPVTFDEGIPARYGRPARALLGWLSWIREGYPQPILTRMIQDGLLRIEEAENDGLNFADLGGMFRSVPIGSGRERYLAKIAGAMNAAERKKASGRLSDEEGEGAGDEAAGLARRIKGLKGIRCLVRGLLSNTPETGTCQRDLLETVQVFLDRHARHTNRFDEYVRVRLSEKIGELADCIGDEDMEGLDIWNWIADLCMSTTVRGEGPRPGRLHVAPVHGGGHSGRKHTFIVGLDDSRFPGAGMQDPLLLDGERIRVSRDLPTAAKRLARTTQGFAWLLARLRGSVTLSYCCRSLTDDREMFPSPVILAAFRSLAGNPQGDQDDLIRWLPEPASFAPSSLDRCLDLTESWVWWMCEGDGVLDPQDALVRSFPHLGRGFDAREARASDRFTEYDGYVPQAGQDLDPTKPDGPVLSASALEMAGACPLAYFFRYVLGIRPPDEVRIDPRIWLDPAERGQLLHAVFRRFMHLLREQDLLPDFRRDEKLLMETLDGELAWWRDSKPAPSRAACERETLDLRQASRIFLQEEEEFCKESRPFCFEASVGMMPEGPGTPLDTLEPVHLKLGRGATLRARGRIDRVDQVPGSEGKKFAVWDYKTGSSWRYRTGTLEDPFRSGRIVQSALYLQLAETRLRETVSPEAVADRFGYFFPTTREHGERVEWTAAELAQGVRVLGNLCEMLTKGAFPFTDDPGDVGYSDYKAAFGDVHAAADAASRKLRNPKNEPLNPFRRLRGYDRE
jgi:ATP-dependent helicase/nuclease subunit B